MQNLSHRSLVKMSHRVEALKKRYHRAIAESESAMENVVGSALTFSSAFGFGVLQGKFASRGGIGVMGVPVELVTALAAYGATFFGFGGRANRYFVPVANGALGAYATTLGRTVGSRMAASTSTSSPTAVRGEATLTPEELARLANPE